MIVHEVIFAIVVMLLFTLAVITGVFLISDPFKDSTVKIRKRNSIFYFLFIFIFSLSATLPFQYINLNGKMVILSKKTLTFKNTIIYRKDIYSAIDVLNTGNSIQQYEVYDQYPITGLIELGLLNQSMEWTEKSISKKYKPLKEKHL